jgi:hypothetical protein
VVRERLAKRACAWCCTPVQYKGRGRPPRYCGAAHRTRAWELRRAQETIREVVERTETIVRTEVREAPVKVKVVPGVRLSGEAYTLPEDAPALGRRKGLPLPGAHRPGLRGHHLGAPQRRARVHCRGPYD